MNSAHINLMPDEPTRFSPVFMDRLLEHAENLKASDITIQTGEPIYAEVYGVLIKLTNRKLSNTELGDLINAIYGPNATTQLLSGKDIDTHYEFRPNRGVRFRYRVNATSCMVEGHDAIQVTLRSIPTTPPKLDILGLPANIIESLAPQEGIEYLHREVGLESAT